ncbi:unnamed protein product [Gongylonema pulchrum]|uniref:G_PROTEIN_RECEP_F1_2 domain-containing protein n=1 Tax=Gongylonema pulchrum TaxID=637853 RepID=A0A183D4S1_9BILA|nr:unnamed protein product [Gongylonema pulchrum]
MPVILYTLPAFLHMAIAKSRAFNILTVVYAIATAWDKFLRALVDLCFIKPLNEPLVECFRHICRRTKVERLSPAAVFVQNGQSRSRTVISSNVQLVPID